jgi:hypothetical protein
MRCEICGYVKEGVKNYTIFYGDYKENKFASGTKIYVQSIEKTVGEISGGVCNSCKLKSIPKNIFYSPITSFIAIGIAYYFNGISPFGFLYIFGVLWLFVSFFLFCFGYWYVSNIGGYLLFFKNRKKIEDSGYNGIKLSRDYPMFQFGKGK